MASHFSQNTCVKAFAPAILCAAEIVQSAEKAENVLAEIQKQKTKRTEEIAELDAQLAGRRQELHKLSREAEAMKEALKPNSKRMHDIESREKAIGREKRQLSPAKKKLRSGKNGQKNWRIRSARSRV
jgi:TolA-binding protein